MIFLSGGGEGGVRVRIRVGVRVGLVMLVLDKSYLDIGRAFKVMKYFGPYLGAEAVSLVFF